VANSPPATSYNCVANISQRSGISKESVRLVLDEFIRSVMECLEAELPFMMNGLGKFYYVYRNGTNLLGRVKAKEFFEGKVHRELHFAVSYTVKGRLQGWVHDLGLKNNIDRKEMLRLAISPTEICKTRRARVLEDQQTMGFNADLLFDESDVPEADKIAIKDAGKAPSVEEMLDRLGCNIKLKKQ
jgi:nucleoid DNA-binding protein